MILPFKLYDLNSKRVIYPQDAHRMGIFLAPDGRPVQFKDGIIVRLQSIDVLHLTGWFDVHKRPVWEHDVVDVDVVHDFEGMVSLTKSKGVVLFEPKDGGFYVKLDNGALNDDESPLENMVVVGSIYDRA
jgi:hypothetical protein